jgi:hypothetical protein
MGRQGSCLTFKVDLRCALFSLKELWHVLGLWLSCVQVFKRKPKKHLRKKQKWHLKLKQTIKAKNKNLMPLEAFA